MKRLLSYSLVCLSLIVTFVTINSYSAQNFSKEKAEQTIVHTAEAYYLSVAELPNDAVANETLNVAIGLQTTVTLHNSQDYLFRLIHSKKLVQQNYLSSAIFYSSYLTLLQLNGYYLFYICKLLI